MRIRILLPTEVLLEQEVSKITAEAENGSFCLLPKHVDFVAALAPGLLSFEEDGGRETFIAVDEGILVKQGPEVYVSTRDAVTDFDLGKLKEAVKRRFQTRTEREKKARSAVARFEVDFLRRFLELEKHG